MGNAESVWIAFVHKFVSHSNLSNWAHFNVSVSYEEDLEDVSIC